MNMFNWSRRIDSKVHKLDGSPHGVVILLLEERGEKDVRPVRKILRKRKFRGISLPLICPGKSFGQNGTNHPHWVKICDNHNGQINLHAKQRYEILSATLLTVCQQISSGLFKMLPTNYLFTDYIYLILYM